MRFFTVPRDTPSLCASVATVLRALVRSWPMRSWSRLSMQQSVNFVYRFVKKAVDLTRSRWFWLPPTHRTIALTTSLHPAMTVLLTPRDVAHIVRVQGIAGALRRLMRYIDADFRRWHEFDKTARSASH